MFDTPYREQAALIMLDAATGAHQTVARFTGHRPAQGPFRCDLHPVPSPDGRRVVVASPMDGGRQLYAPSR